MGGDLADDIMQDIYLTILSHSQEKQRNIADNLTAYVYSSVRNNSRAAQQFGSKYSKTWERAIYESEHPSDNGRGERGIMAKLELSRAREIISSIHWYDRKIFELYHYYGSMRKLEAATGIEVNSIFLAVTKVKSILKRELEL